MTHLFKSLSQIDINDKYIVFGYVREAQKSFESNEMCLFSNIPIMISSICILYYHITDYFEQKKDRVLLSSDKKTIEQITSNWGPCNPCYGTLIVPSISKAIYEWEIKIKAVHVNALQHRSHIMIGITSDWDKDTFPWKSNSLYYWGYTGCKVFKTKSINGQPFGLNDTVSITLDLFKKELSFCVNGINQGIAFKNIPTSKDIQYKMAVNIHHEGSSVSIIKYKESYLD